MSKQSPAAACAHAQGILPCQEYEKRIRSAEMAGALRSDLFGDNISLDNGATEFRAADVDLPGNNSFPVQLNRRFKVEVTSCATGGVSSPDVQPLGSFGAWTSTHPASAAGKSAVISCFGRLVTVSNPAWPLSGHERPAGCRNRLFVSHGIWPSRSERKGETNMVGIRHAVAACLALWLGVATDTRADPADFVGQNNDKRIARAQAIEALSPDLFGDEVSLKTGDTEFKITDVSIPGNNALPVGFSRRYKVKGERCENSGDCSVEAWSALGDWEWDFPHLFGTFPRQTGWQVDGSTPDQRCSVARPSSGPWVEGVVEWYRATLKKFLAPAKMLVH